MIMKKIMFNDKYGLTQAVLEGRKTMTRRVVKGEIPLGNWEKTEKYAPYQVGEVVAIAQPYKDIYNDAYHIGLYGRTAGWSNKMYVAAYRMPHHIKITNIRVERLHDISNEDCLREGIEKCNIFGYRYNVHSSLYPINTTSPTARESFAELIDKVSGVGTWESNPLVWVYEFELVD